MFCGGDHAREAFDPLTFLWLQVLAAPMECRRRDDPVHQRRRIGGAAVHVPRHGAERGLGQAGFDLPIQLFDGGDLAAQAQHLGDLARFDDGSVHAKHSQLRV